jgi:mycofactocin precursor
VPTPTDSTVESPAIASSPPATSPESDRSRPPADEEIVEAEVLIEDVSIDGMCGVY